MGSRINFYLLFFFKRVIDNFGLNSNLASIAVNPEVFLKENCFVRKARGYIVFQILILSSFLILNPFFPEINFFKLSLVFCFFGFINSIFYLFFAVLQERKLKTDVVPEDSFLLFGSIFVFVIYKSLIFLFFSKLIPNQEKRVEEIYRFINESALNQSFYYDLYFHKKSEIESFKTSLKNSLNEGAKVFYSKHFTYSQSVFRSWIEKVYIEGRINENFLFHSLMIPRKREIDPESLKLIFVSLAQKEYLEFNFTSLEEVENISKKFKKMKVSKIVQLFSRPFDLQDFYSAITNNIEGRDDMNHFFLFNEKTIINEALNTIESDLFQIKLLKSKMDYWVASEDFKNCLKDYFLSNSEDVLVFYKNNNPFACVSVDLFGKIGEISGYENRFVDYADQDLIKKIILNKLGDLNEKV